MNYDEVNRLKRNQVTTIVLILIKHFSYVFYEMNTREEVKVCFLVMFLIKRFHLVLNQS